MYGEHSAFTKAWRTCHAVWTRRNFRRAGSCLGRMRVLYRWRVTSKNAWRRCHTFTLSGLHRGGVRDYVTPSSLLMRIQLPGNGAWLVICCVYEFVDGNVWTLTVSEVHWANTKWQLCLGIRSCKVKCRLQFTSSTNVPKLVRWGMRVSFCPLTRESSPVAA